MVRYGYCTQDFLLASDIYHNDLRLGMMIVRFAFFGLCVIGHLVGCKAAMNYFKRRKEGGESENASPELKFQTRKSMHLLVVAQAIWGTSFALGVITMAPDMIAL